MTSSVEDLLGRFIEDHVLLGVTRTAEELCGARADLVEPLRRAIAHYFAATDALERGFVFEGGSMSAFDGEIPVAGPLPSFAGFRTIERLGRGGMGEVYKLHDLALDRVVAAKVVRRDSRVPAGLGDFLREAKTLALFKDPRIVQIYEFRAAADPPVIVMEFVDGFELGQLGPSLDFRQRARIVRDVADALARAHSLGLQHRDLKPSNIMLDAALTPRILDFGLSGRDPASGHFRGTPAYLAPEQLDSSRPIDPRTDIYAMGVILYELLCGTVPFAAGDPQSVVEAIRSEPPRLPIELNPAVPEPLQAIALEAMEKSPADRYQTAGDLVLDLQRFLDGHPVLARPTVYAKALGSRLVPHLAQIEDWLRLKLIYPHEADEIRRAYRKLDAREDDWILESRSLTYSQIALYLGAAVLMVGSLLYFAADRIHEAVDGIAAPLAVLGLPFIGLNAAARALQRRDHRAVAVAFYLGGVALLPLLMLILFNETAALVAPAGDPGQLVADGWVSNRQLQVTAGVTLLWTCTLALHTRTVALSSLATLAGLLMAGAVVADFGLRTWIEAGRWDRLAFHFMPLAALYAAAGAWQERARRPWFARPLYAASVLVLFLCLELIALDGRMLAHVGLSMARLQPAGVSDPRLLDTLTAMTLNGLACYTIAWLAERHGSPLMRDASDLLFTISPFAALQPIGWISKSGEYARAFDWLYLVLALGSALVSQPRQRRAFYYAGVVNTLMALVLIFDHYEWFDRPSRAVLVIIAGLVGLAAGLALDRRERRRRRS